MVGQRQWRELNSHLLAQVLSEEACSGRPLGTSKLTTLTKSALLLVTGNCVVLSEDLTRRFLVVELDPRCENPENRRFSGDFVDEIMRRRGELLAAALTIWRWGRQQKNRPGHADWKFRAMGKLDSRPASGSGMQDPIARHAENEERRSAAPEPGRVLLRGAADTATSL